PAAPSPGSLLEAAARRLDVVVVIADHRLAGDGALADQHPRLAALGQIDIDPTAEADEAEAVAAIQLVARLDEPFDAAGQKARDLHEADLAALAVAHHVSAALIVVAILVHAGINELAGPVFHLLQHAGDRGAVHMHVEHI